MKKPAVALSIPLTTISSPLPLGSRYDLEQVVQLGEGMVLGTVPEVDGHLVAPPADHGVLLTVDNVLVS